MTTARRQSSPPPVHRLTAPAVPVDGTDARGKMQGKIKGGGTSLRAKPVCTWVGRGTRQGAAPCRAGVKHLIGAAVAACLTRWAALPLDGGNA